MYIYSAYILNSAYVVTREINLYKKKTCTIAVQCTATLHNFKMRGALHVEAVLLHSYTLYNLFHWE